MKEEIVSVPCGVFVFLNNVLLRYARQAGRVSVPCGVFVFLNKSFRESPARASWVSVPCGVFVFLNKEYHIEREDVEDGFRPLRGLRISQCLSDVRRRNREVRVSVPCGVFVFLNPAPGSPYKSRAPEPLCVAKLNQPADASFKLPHNVKNAHFMRCGLKLFSRLPFGQR